MAAGRPISWQTRLSLLRVLHWRPIVLGLTSRTEAMACRLWPSWRMSRAASSRRAVITDGRPPVRPSRLAVSRPLIVRSRMS